MTRTHNSHSKRSRNRDAIRSRKHYQLRKVVPCPDCNEKFSCQFNVDQHWRAKHGLIKPYSCWCGKAYGRRFELNRHMSRSGHSQSNEKDGNVSSVEEDDCHFEGDTEEDVGGGTEMPDEAIADVAIMVDNFQLTTPGPLYDQETSLDQSESPMTDFGTLTDHDLEDDASESELLEAETDVADMVFLNDEQLIALEAQLEANESIETEAYILVCRHEDCSFSTSSAYDLTLHQAHIDDARDLDFGDGEMVHAEAVQAVVMRTPEMLFPCESTDSDFSLEAQTPQVAADGLAWARFIDGDMTLADLIG